MTVEEATTGTTTETKIGNVTENHSGTTTENKKGDVTENNLANKAENTTGNVTINTTGTTTEIKIGNVTESHSGATTENNKGDVTVNNLDNKIESTTGSNSIYSTGNTCVTSQADANFYGKASTNIGVACDGTKGSATTVYGSSTVNVSGGTITETSTSNTNVNVGGNLIEKITGNTDVTVSGTTAIKTKNGTTIQTTAGDTNINTTGNTNITSSSAISVTATDDICIKSNDVADFYGKTSTNIGVACDGSKASATTIVGTTTINISGKTINQSGDTYNITANTKNTGDLTVTKKLYLTPDCTNKITSTTVNAALCEVFDRSVVTMTKNASPSDTRLAAVYKLYQNGVQIGNDINVPKDGFLKSVELVDVNGVSNLRFTWYIYDADTQTYSTGTTDVSVEDLVKEIEANNSKTDRGANVNVWYNSTTKKMNVSADTTITIAAAGGNKTFTKSAGTHTLNAYKLTLTHNGLVNAEFDPFVASTSLTLPHSALTIEYGVSVTGKSNDSYNTSAAKTVSIPTCVSHLNRRKLSWSKGKQNTGTYDPGASCDNAASGTNIVIPGELSDLTNWVSGCLEVGGCVKATGFYQSSDRNLKENIEKPNSDKFVNAYKVPISKFNYKDDETKRDVYGVIAQEVEAHGFNELIHVDENGNKSVDYTSLMILKIGYLENENARLMQKLNNLEDRLNKLEGKA